MSEQRSERKTLWRLLVGCPIWTYWQESDGGFRVGVRNVSWCRVVQAEFVIDGQKIKKQLDIPPMENSVISFEEVAAEPKNWIIATTMTNDGVVWSLKQDGVIEVGAPAVPDAQQTGYAEFCQAWRFTDPLYQPEVTKKYWRCGCGQVNDGGRIYCGNCRKGRDWVVRHVNGEAVLKTLSLREQKKQEEQRYLEKQAKKRLLKKKKLLRLGALTTAIAVAVGAVVLTVTEFVLPSRRYAEAQAFMKVDRYYEAYVAFAEISDFKDSEEQMLNITRLLTNESLLSAGHRHIVKNNNTGTVSGTGYVFDGALMVDKWNGVCAVAAGKDHSLGLHYDGSVISVGKKDKGACEVLSWANMVQVSAGDDFSVGLQQDGKVLATGKNSSGQCDVRKWQDITFVSAGKNFTVGLQKDGTVVATGDNTYGQCNVSDWKDVIYVTTGATHTVGITKDGKVLATGRNTKGACEVSEWKGVVAVTAGDQFTIGIKADGSMISTGKNDLGQCDVEDISDAIGVVAGYDYAVVMLSNGTLQFLGTNREGEGMIDQWMLHQ